MKRDKQFVINSIKMDLHRVVTAAGDVTKEPPMDSILTFLKHADQEFEKIPLNPRERSIRQDLKQLTKTVASVTDPQDRLRWAEDVLTSRCRL